MSVSVRETLPHLDVVAELAQALGGDHTRVEAIGAWGSGKTLIAVQTAAALGRPLVILAAGRVDAEGIFEDVVSFAGEERAVLLPAWEVLPTDAMAPADDIVAERMNALKRLTAETDPAHAPIAVIPVRSLLQAVAPKSVLLDRSVTLRVGEEHDLEALIVTLLGIGYDRELMVERRGQMSVRGGIFDIFPISSELPYRLEFFGDEIESIRRFEPETQRSLEDVDALTVLPRSEKALLRPQAQDDTALGSIMDYFAEGTLVVLDEPAAVAEEARKAEEQSEDSPYALGWEDVQTGLDSFPRLETAQVAYRAPGDAPRFTVSMGSMTRWQGHADEFWEELQKWDADGYTVAIMCANPGERRRLLELFEEHGYRPGQDPFDVRFTLGRLRAGFLSHADGLAVLSEREIFGRRYVRRTRRRFEAGAPITAFTDLKPGDLVVHAHHGIGRYLGLKRFEGKAGDFVGVQYAKGDKLFMPVTHIDAIQKYVGGEGTAPRIDKLGGATWARTRARVKKAVRDMTDELLKLYATRESRTGHAFPPDTPWQAEFEDAFQYDETVDQARAIQEVKGDMEVGRPMDRLLCGDVGYGKTEVALRAAFKAVMDGTQVALLCPTTVLAEQHYTTFKERLADFPIKIDLLCRFRSPKQQKQTVEKLKSGEVDIVIGTHRLVSKDIGFKNLGLLVIDEEQRFGVAHKERLKHLRAVVDVLTMTATPIPRTLNLALLGARDMSVINTAPNDRLPVHTCIDAFDERLIREAIRRELARQGQVFFVHNRVQTILPFVALIQKLVPGVRADVGHGQMPEAQLEAVMTRFIHAEIDVLVCTNIIGAGLDIPNANTIIINNADHFGLAELYQLRGRVGRYKHRAFAYLLVPEDRVPTEDAQKRLKALEDFSSLGAGFRIAMRDLEIRGCGNILGGEQHGHIAAVGYEAYTQLVEEAVAELKGEPTRHRTLPPCEIAIDAYIPEAYMPSEAQKVTLYKRIAGVQTADEVDEMHDEIKDRFGMPPAPVRRLLQVMRVRALAADARAKRVLVATSAVTVEFESAAFLTRPNRAVLTEEYGPRIAFQWQGNPSITLRTGGDSPESALKAAAHLLETLGEM